MTLKDNKMKDKPLSEKAIDYWKTLKEADLNNEGIKGEEKQNRLIPSKATIFTIGFIIQEYKEAVSKLRGYRNRKVINGEEMILISVDEIDKIFGELK